MFSAQISFSRNALEPILSAETIDYHYGKHHVGYADTLNSLIIGTEFQGLSLGQIILLAKEKKQLKIFNNAAQLFNHDFYWQCLSNPGKFPTEKMLDLINVQFGNFDKFREEYISFASTMFGSGWSWLIYKDSKLAFLNTSNADNPLGSDAIPLCVVDLWEHAYYIDYRNNRSNYIRKLIIEGINWEFCSNKLM